MKERIHYKDSSSTENSLMGLSPVARGHLIVGHGFVYDSPLGGGRQYPYARSQDQIIDVHGESAEALGRALKQKGKEFML